VVLHFLFMSAGVRSSRALQQYEEFYNSTLDDIDSATKMLDELVNRRHIISDDPDVQNVYKVIVIIHDILLGYQHAPTGKQKRKDSKK
jgi:hypothetical protein